MSLLEIVHSELGRLRSHKNIIPQIQWHYGNFGKAVLLESGKLGLQIPYPTNDLRLGICLHEIGHLYLGHMDFSNIELSTRIDLNKRSISHQFQIEKEACDFAIERMQYYNRDVVDIIRLQNDYLAKIKEDMILVKKLVREFDKILDKY